MSLVIKIGNITINTFLLMRNKFVYSCSIKIHALGFDELWENIFWILLVVEVFCLQKVVKILEEVIVGQWKVKVAQLCLTLCYPMDCSLQGFSVHGIFQARVLEWVAIPFSRGSSWPRDWTWVSCIVGRRFTLWATMEAQMNMEDEAKLCSPICSTFEALVVWPLVGWSWRRIGPILLTSASCRHCRFQYISLICGEGNGTPLQHSCLENPMGGGAW